MCTARLLGFTVRLILMLIDMLSRILDLRRKEFMFCMSVRKRAVVVGHVVM